MKKKPNDWTDEQIASLRRLYPTTRTADLVPLIGRSLDGIKRKASVLGLKKDNYFWSRADEKKLVKIWPTLPASKLAELFGKTESAVTTKYRELTGLR